MSHKWIGGALIVGGVYEAFISTSHVNHPDASGLSLLSAGTASIGDLATMDGASFYLSIAAIAVGIWLLVK